MCADVLAWPLRGRARELGVVVRAVDPQGPGGVVISGRAGVGKTRLARAALTAAARSGATTRWVVATGSAAVIPLGALATILPRTPGSADATPFELLQSAAATLAEAGGGRRLVLGVDDAHLLDDVSATLVHQLVLAGTIILVATVRTSEPTPDPIVALWKDELVRVDLSPLPRDVVDELLPAVLDGPVDAITAERLWRLSQGNPLFLRELVESARAGRGLERRGGVWTWHGSFEGGPRLTDLVSSRLPAHGSPGRRLVELLAWGEWLDIDALAELVPAETIAAAERDGTIVVDVENGRQQVRLAHPLYAEVARDETGTQVAGDRQRSLAGVLAGRPLEQPYEVIRLARLYLEADGTADLDLLTRAASVADAWLDYAGAERFARAGVEVAGRNAFPPRFALAHALMWQGRTAEADAEFRRLVELADTDEDRALAGFHLVESLYWWQGQPSAAESALATLQDSVRTPRARCTLDALRSVVLLVAGRTRAALELALSVMSASVAAPHAIAWASATASWGWGFLGRWQDAKAAQITGWEASRQATQHPVHTWLPLSDSEIVALRLAGRLSEADHWAQLYHDRGVGRSNAAFAATGGLWVGQLALARGQPVTARRWLHQSLPALTDVDPFGYRSLAYLALAEACALTGDVVAARQALDDARAARRPPTAMYAPAERLGEAWVAAAAGELTRATTLALEAAEVARSYDQPAVEAGCLHATLRLGDNTRARRLADLAAGSDSHLMDAYAAHAAGLTASDGGTLERTAQRFVDLGARLLGAEAYAHAAAAHRAAGRHVAALTAGARVHELLQDCEGARTPATHQANPLAQLSRREREISGLAARGLANKAIAERLSISVRTVESHLAKTYAKLDVSARAELAQLFRAESGTDGRPATGPAAATRRLRPDGS